VVVVAQVGLLAALALQGSVEVMMAEVVVAQVCLLIQVYVSYIPMRKIV